MPSILSLSPLVAVPVMLRLGPPLAMVAGAVPVTKWSQRHHPRVPLLLARLTRPTALPGVAGIDRQVAGSAVATAGDVS